MPSTRPFARPSALFCLVAFSFPSPAEAQTPAMVEFFAGGKLQKGMPLADLTHEMIVIGRDGWMHSLNPQNPAAKLRKLDERYQPVSVTELRNELRAEFGHAYEVVSTKNFLVVQPKGRGDRWPRLFEQSHRSFIDFMRKRGVNIREGRFPMVAIVYPDEQAMYGELKRLKIDVTRVAGLYSVNSNRVMTHDGGQSAMIAETVRHEAAHQSAFNSGVHSRVNDTPRWITEGLGQMFEPSAMANSMGTARLPDRINRDSLSFIRARFTDRHDTRFSQTVFQLIGDDTMFENQKQVDEAYAVSWSMMFYLAERQPKAFARLLNHTAARPPFLEYARKDRIHDFERLVGVDAFEFAKRVGWYLQSM